MKINKMISWIAVVIWMIVIFHLSSQVADKSNQLSSGLTKIILDLFEKLFHYSDFDISEYNHIIRKNAHFIAYLVLGVLVINALRKNNYRGVVFVFLICVFYAITDEMHQMFVPGRGPSVKDVIIDSAGAGFGILIYLEISKILSKKKRDIKS